MADQEQPAAGAAPTETPTETRETLSLNVTLADLSARADHAYAHKNYTEASDFFSQAAELQNEIHGDELDPRNADILFKYGQCLFKLGQQTSDVLGGKAPEQQGQQGLVKGKKAGGQGKKMVKTNGEGGNDGGEAVTKVEDVVASAADEKMEEKAAEVGDAKKPMFQFTGDENFADSDEEEEGDDAEEAEGEEEEEQDDLAAAFDILDLARVLYDKRLETSSTSPTSDAPPATEDPATRVTKERLAETYELLAEISLENERYPQAITDSRSCLKLKQQLYPEESEIIAEAHFKLSLALEFASQTQQADDTEASTEGDGEKKPAEKGAFDQGMRDEAAEEMAAAIKSTKLKLQAKEVELATLHDPQDNDATRRTIADVREMISEMEQRLDDLRKPPVDVDAALTASNPMLSGILAAAAGKGASGAATIEEAKKNANDLSGLVRKKKVKDVDAGDETRSNGSATGKRKASGAVGDEGGSKKARVEDVEE